MIERCWETYLHNVHYCIFTRMYVTLNRRKVLRFTDRSSRLQFTIKCPHDVSLNSEQSGVASYHSSWSPTRSRSYYCGNYTASGLVHHEDMFLLVGNSERPAVKLNYLGRKRDYLPSRNLTLFLYQMLANKLTMIITCC